jgi:hypothetical protein
MHASTSLLYHKCVFPVVVVALLAVAVLCSTHIVLSVFTWPCVILPHVAAGGARTPIIIPLVFRGKSSGMPSDLRVKIAAAHTNEAGEPRMTVTEFQVGVARVRLDAPVQVCVTC